MRLRLRNERHLEAVPTSPPVELPAGSQSQQAHALAEAEPAAGIAGRMLRGQLSGSDARTERLVRQVRAEIDELRSLLDSSVEARDGLFALDYESIAGDPEAVASLPHETLVRSLLTAARRVLALEAEVEAQDADLANERAKADELKREMAWMRGRHESLSEVIGALHANLEDLRRARDVMLAIDGEGAGGRRTLPAGDS